MEPTDFEQTLYKARPGTVITYHVGESLHGCKNRRQALRAYYDGLVDLCQRRVGGGKFAYLAVRRRRVRAPDYPLRYEALVHEQTSRWNGR
jgi:hypothetical protein